VKAAEEIPPVEGEIPELRQKLHEGEEDHETSHGQPENLFHPDGQEAVKKPTGIPGS